MRVPLYLTSTSKAKASKKTQYCRNRDARMSLRKIQKVIVRPHCTSYYPYFNAGKLDNDFIHAIGHNVREYYTPPDHHFVNIRVQPEGKGIWLVIKVEHTDWNMQS